MDEIEKAYKKLVRQPYLCKHYTNKHLLKGLLKVYRQTTLEEFDEGE